MKRIPLLLILALFISVSATAQSSQGHRQKMIHVTAVRIAEHIDVRDSDKDAFISLYQNYKKETGEIMRVRPESTDDVEKAAEAKILSDFDKSKKILSLRKTYYFKFREILSPTQIQKMYDLEKTMISSR